MNSKSIPSRTRRSLAGLALAVLVLAQPAAQANLVTGAEQYNAGVLTPSPISCVSGDLLEMSGVSVSGELNTGWRDGTFGYSGTAYNESPFTVTYALNLASNPSGYDIKEIRVFSGHDSVRSAQSYDVLYSLVEAPDTFHSLCTVLTPIGRNGAVMTRTCDSSAGASPDTGSAILILSRVAKIRFNMRPGGYGTVFREVDVTGSPTPSTPQKNITGFTFPTYGAASMAGTDISIDVPYGADLTALSPTYTLSYGATCVPASGDTRNFSSPVQYTVTASDHTTQAYTVTAVVRSIPDPVFTLVASTNPWDGRQRMIVTPDITNWSALEAAGGADLNYSWSVAGIAVSKLITPPTPTETGILSLLSSQGSGALTVTLVLDNGGWPSTRTLTVNVQEPASEAWVQRTPGATEKPVNNQFFARDDTGMGTIHYKGTLGGSPDGVFLKVYTTETGPDVLYATLRQALSGGAYAFAAPIEPGLVTYKVVFGSTTGGVDTPIGSPVGNLVCGDAYIIQGQSNAVADNPDNPYTSPWIRSFGDMGGSTASGWGNAVRATPGDAYRIGYWGMDLAIDLVTTYNMPVCILNGAVGGTRIDQHQRNDANHADPATIYGRLLTRVAAAQLTHGIRGVLWHQGENNSGAAAPTGDWDYKSYQQYFVDLSADWKQDYPNIRNYYLFQVWPLPCSMGPKGDQLREVQRTLPRLYSNMSVLSTVGVSNGRGLCHFDSAGYAGIASLISPLVMRDQHGWVPPASITAPDLKRAWFTTAGRNAIALEFDQDMVWNSAATVNVYLDGVGGKVLSGSASGKVITLQLNGTSTSETIDYVVDQYWNGNSSNLLRGDNGIAALTFAEVPIAGSPPTPFSDWAADPAQGLTAGVNDGLLDDPDFDGLFNLFEFTVGGQPMVSSQDFLPVLAAPAAGAWTYAYNRSVLSRPPATTQVVEYGADLSDWAQEVIIPLNSDGSVTITPGPSLDHVEVTLPAKGTSGFARLNVTP